MNLEDLKNLKWLDPWYQASPGLEAELERETGTGHPLHGRKAISVGRRFDRDDVLFILPDNPSPLAVVHLTWKGKREKDPEWPRTTFYSSLEDWIENRMKPDHYEYAGDAE